jgi:hypothetical protein
MASHTSHTPDCIAEPNLHHPIPTSLLAMRAEKLTPREWEMEKLCVVIWSKPCIFLRLRGRGFPRQVDRTVEGLLAPILIPTPQTALLAV